MKQLTILTLIIIALSSCSTPEEVKQANEQAEQIRIDTKQTNHQKMIDKAVIVKDRDGCQYIILTSFSGTSAKGFMSHKGLCNNPKHKQ